MNNYSQFTVPKDGVIVVEGDDLTYGTTRRDRAAGINGSDVRRSATPFPETLSRLLDVKVENRSYPGDTIAQGQTRWAGRPEGNLLIIGYGYGDAKARTSLADFEAVLDEMILDAKRHGAGVILLAAPTYSDKSLSDAADLSRQAMRQAQGKYGVPVFEVWKAENANSPTFTDGSYQTDATYRTLAYTVAPYIAVAPARAGATGDDRPTPR